MQWLKSLNDPSHSNELIPWWRLLLKLILAMDKERRDLELCLLWREEDAPKEPVDRLHVNLTTSRADCRALKVLMKRSSKVGELGNVGKHQEAEQGPPPAIRCGRE